MNKEFRRALLYLFPLLFFVCAFLLMPIIGTFWNSLQQDVAFLPKKFVGLDNYFRLMRDNGFWKASRFTLLFVITSVLLEMILGIITALIINEKFKLRGMMRGIILLPWAIPAVVSARIWQLMYQFEYGIANYVFRNLFGIEVNWLGSSIGAFFSLVFADVWRTTPFVAIIILAGLQIIPEDVYKQAKVDGASIFQRFYRITLPLLKPILVIALLFRTIDAMRVFDIIFVITGGGPGGSTNSISTHGYEFFLNSDYGYGSAVSIILFILAFSVALLYIRLGGFQKETL